MFHDTVRAKRGVLKRYEPFLDHRETTFFALCQNVLQFSCLSIIEGDVRSPPGDILEPIVPNKELVIFDNLLIMRCVFWHLFPFLRTILSSIKVHCTQSVAAAAVIES